MTWMDIKWRRLRVFGQTLLSCINVTLNLQYQITILNEYQSQILYYLYLNLTLRMPNKNVNCSHIYHLSSILNFYDSAKIAITLSSCSAVLHTHFILCLIDENVITIITGRPNALPYIFRTTKACQYFLSHLQCSQLLPMVQKG